MSLLNINSSATRTEWETKKHQKAVSAVANRPHSRRRKTAPAPVTIVTAAGIATVEFRKSGRPTNEGLRQLSAVSDLKLPGSAE